MGTLGNTIFQTLMGWIRVLWVSVWTTATNQGGTLLSWIGAHWKGLAILLCVAGVLIDGAVYFFRWQPWRVWRSFCRRIREGDPEAWMDEPSESMEPEDENLDETAEGAAWRPVTEPEPEAWPRSAAEQLQAEEYPGPAEAWESETGELTYGEPDRTEQESNTALFSQAIVSQRRRSISRLLADENQKAAAPEELIDRNAAYRRPVYPRSWQMDTQREEEPDEFD